MPKKSTKKNILFLHPNIPGQFKHLCHLLAKDHRVVFITKENNKEIPGVYKCTYKMDKDMSSRTHRYLQNFEMAVHQGQEVWRTAKMLKDKEGFVPDVVVTHPGWGDALFVKDIFPDAPLLSFFEFYYALEGADIGFDPTEKIHPDTVTRVRMKNSCNLHNLEACDWGLSPTWWQMHLHPKEFHHKISVMHDGIDTDLIQPDDDVSVTINKNLKLHKSDEVVTYFARNFEPYRGFPTFMRAAAKILKARPNVQIVVVGADGVSYGKKLPEGQTYRKLMMKEVQFSDPSRIHFVGFLPHEKLRKMMQVSSAHIYLTFPFVLSWSSMEAMASECLMIASNTKPVIEVMEDQQNALLVDFFNADDVAEKVIKTFEHKDRHRDIRKAARQTILDKYDLKDILPLQEKLVLDMAEGKLPPPAAKKIEQEHTSKIRKVTVDGLVS